MQGSKTKDWAEALRRAVHRESDGKGSPKWLEVLANRCVEAAADGDMTAMKEIGDRLDGKPHQSSDVAVDAKVKAEGFRIEFVTPENPDR